VKIPQKSHLFPTKGYVMGRFSYFSAKSHGETFFGLNRCEACFIVMGCVVFDELGWYAAFLLAAYEHLKTGRFFGYAES